MSRLSATETLLDTEPANRASIISMDSGSSGVDEMDIKKEESDELSPEIKAEPTGV